MESRRFAVLALLEAPENGLLSEWLTVRERMKVETVRDNTSRLLHQINKLFSSLGLLVSSAVVGCRGAERSAVEAHALAVPTRLHGVSSVSPSWERSPVFSGWRRSAARPGDTKAHSWPRVAPFMGAKYFAGRIR